jgi:transcriptional regulator with XRE-family HTH domain
MNSIGKVLKAARLKADMKLRQVEDHIGISNAYLSQLENDKIKKPSADVLYKLSNLYKIDINSLLSASGAIQNLSNDNNRNYSDWINKMEFYANGLNEEDRNEILSFVKFKASK